VIEGQAKVIGQERAVEQFLSAWKSGAMHHAWLLAGPRGVGKAAFAMAAAERVLAESAGPLFTSPGLDSPADHSVGRLVAAGSHPDFRLLERLVNEKTGNLARGISVDQVRELGELFAVTPALSPWRAVVIDSVDDLEASAANALLKMLEEPPANCLFLLVSHVPGRLLPTIRSRCRRLELQPLNDDAMTSVLEGELPDLAPVERAKLLPLANGSVGRALAFASLDLAPIQEQALAILRDGDGDNARRAKLAQLLGPKAAADRYAAFLDMAPALIAREALGLDGAARRRALDAYARARETSRLAPRHSLDPAATVFQLGTILASVAPPSPSR
jgi:DNA polymerase-3 subunit delta'